MSGRVSVAGRWMDDKEVNECLWCNDKFTVVRRKHHCRVCGGIFCGRCTAEKLTLEVLPGKAAKKEQRVCVGCFKDATEGKGAAGSPPLSGAAAPAPPHAGGGGAGGGAGNGDGTASGPAGAAAASTLAPADSGVPPAPGGSHSRSQPTSVTSTASNDSGSGSGSAGAGGLGSASKPGRPAAGSSATSASTAGVHDDDTDGKRRPFESSPSSLSLVSDGAEVTVDPDATTPQLDLSGVWQVKITLKDVLLNDEQLSKEYEQKLQTVTKATAAATPDRVPPADRPRVLSCEEYKATVRRSTLQHLMATQEHMRTSWTLRQAPDASGVIKGTTGTGAAVRGVTAGMRVRLEYRLQGRTGLIRTEVLAKLYPGDSNIALKGKYVTTAEATGLVTVRSVIGSRPGAATAPAALPHGAAPADAEAKARATSSHGDSDGGKDSGSDAGAGDVSSVGSVDKRGPRGATPSDAPDGAAQGGSDDESEGVATGSDTEPAAGAPAPPAHPDDAAAPDAGGGGPADASGDGHATSSAAGLQTS